MAGEGDDLFPVHPLQSVAILSSPAADEGRELLLLQLPLLRVRSIRSMTRDIAGSLLLLLWLSAFRMFSVSIYGSPAAMTMYVLQLLANSYSVSRYELSCNRVKCD